MRTFKIAALAAVSSVALTSFACAQEKLKIGLLTTLSGPAAALGVQQSARLPRVRVRERELGLEVLALRAGPALLADPKRLRQELLPQPDHVALGGCQARVDGLSRINHTQNGWSLLPPFFVLVLW